MTENGESPIKILIDCDGNFNGILLPGDELQQVKWEPIDLRSEK